MNLKPISKEYEFRELLSENNLTQSWLAVRINSGQKCFIKTVSPNGDLDGQTKRNFLLRSFESQRPIKTSRVITARRKFLEKQNIFIEYPYLDGNRWKKLSPESFWEYFPESLLQICSIVDYTHILNLVHCDLKLDNFLIEIGADHPNIIMVDLDFLCSVNTLPKSKIFGTPEHIAPEIIENKKIVRQTDCYSLGILLRDSLSSIDNILKTGIPDITETEANVRRLIENLTNIDPEMRPGVLINALQEYNIIGKSELEMAQRTLLASQLISRYWKEKGQILKNKQGLIEFLVEKNNIFGLHDEFLSDLDLLLKKSPALFMQTFKTLIRDASIEFFDYYWQLNPSDKLLISLYEQMNAQIDIGHIYPKEIGDVVRLERLHNLAVQVADRKDNSQALKSFLFMKRTLDEIDSRKTDKDKEKWIGILDILAGLAAFLGRPIEASDLLTRAMEISKRDINTYLSFLYRLSFLEISREKYLDAEKWIDEGIEKSKPVRGNILHGDFLRLKAWIAGYRGEHDRSKETLLKVEKMAKALNNELLLSKTLQDIGMYYRRLGDFKISEKYLLLSIKSAKKSDNLSGLASAYGNLSMLNLEGAYYIRVIKYGLLAFKAAGKKADENVLKYVYINLAMAYSRINNPRNVSVWLEKYRATTAFKNDRRTRQRYYFTHGSCMRNLGNLQSAAASLEKGLQLHHEGDPIGSIGKAHFSLSLTYLFQGKLAKCSTNIDKAKSIIIRLKDKASLAEITLIEQLNNEYNLGLERGKELIKTLDDLVKANCHYNAVLCLLYILLNKTGDIISRALKISGPLYPIIRTSEAPVFSAASRILYSRKGKLRVRSFNVSTYKDMNRILDDAGNKFFTIQICCRIAEYYLSISKPKLAVKFYIQAKKIAESADNKTLSEKITEKIESIKSVEDNYGQIRQTILGISEILKEIDNYEGAIERLIQFVVDETGAERGVLLMASEKEPHKLRIKSSINCDVESLSDIEQISHSIPAYVSKELTPMIIEDALKDKRTSKYKSIVMHNIRSVICLPITIEGKNRGVLYLDHHTIPALFEMGDIIFIKSIANFISIVLSTIYDYKKIEQSRRQLQEQIDNLELGQQFVFQSEVMEELLSGLQDIAESDASVLITGESGTGKGMLCRMIHGMSNRSKEPLVQLNSSSIASTLIESELFGVAKSVATGVEPREGKFSAADGGTLFFDEIADMPSEIQAKILRVVEDQTFEKVGSNRTISTDIRFIYATNRNLEELIKSGKFRSDLYYRINTVEIELPPLRERPDDIPVLIRHFLKVYAKDERKRPSLSEGAMLCLLSYGWPGNVRELRNAVERFCILHPGKIIKLKDIPRNIIQNAEDESEKLLRAKIIELLYENNWNKSKVARILEMSLTTLRRRMKKFKIPDKRPS